MMFFCPKCGKERKNLTRIVKYWKLISNKETGARKYADRKAWTKCSGCRTHWIIYGFFMNNIFQIVQVKIDIEKTKAMKSSKR